MRKTGLRGGGGWEGKAGVTMQFSAATCRYVTASRAAQRIQVSARRVSISRRHSAAWERRSIVQGWAIKIAPRGRKTTGSCRNVAETGSLDAAARERQCIYIFRVDELAAGDFSASSRSVPLRIVVVHQEVRIARNGARGSPSIGTTAFADARSQRGIPRGRRKKKLAGSGI